MKTRKERMDAAAEQMKALKPGYDAYQQAEAEYRKAEQSLDVGTRVKVTEGNCGLGCCNSYDEGVIVHIQPSGRYEVRYASGRVGEEWRSALEALS